MKDLLPFCRSERQREVLLAIEAHGGKHQAAKALGITVRRVFEHIETITRYAAKQGHAPAHDMTHTVPDGFKVKGVSTYYNDDGKPIGQWVKSVEDGDRREEILREVAESLSKDLPRIPAIKAPSKTEADLCNVYTLTDSHVGMLAWKEEGGADWDMTIAERVLTGAFLAMMEAARPAKTCVIAQLGDFLHFDGLNPVTPTSGHVLDASARFGDMVQGAIRIMRRIIDAALAKHSVVHLLIAQGNHDQASSVWMRHLFAAVYERNKRLVIVQGETPYYAIKHGRTMLAWHHGHLKKNDALPLLMATQYSEMWGSTDKRYCHVGHRHHVEIKEHSGMTVVQHSTLAARDAYASRGGWHSERQAKAITYHAEYGEVASVIVTPEMLR